jgi:hypothetical protein
MQQYATPAVATAADTFEDGGGRLPAVVQRRRWLLEVHASKSKNAKMDGQVPSITGSRGSMFYKFRTLPRRVMPSSQAKHD